MERYPLASSLRGLAEMRLQGRSAIVTGAASGIGRAIAVRFADEGARVIASDIREGPIWAQGDARSTADVISSRGGSARFIKADVSDPEDVDRLVGAALEDGGRLDVM